MKLPVRESSAAAIETALAEINGRASSFALTTYAEIAAAAASAETAMQRAGIPKAARSGAVLVFRPAGPFTAAYKYSVKATVITLARASSGVWNLVEIHSAQVRPKESEWFRLKVSEAARAAAVRAALAPFAL